MIDHRREDLDYLPSDCEWPIDPHTKTDCPECGNGHLMSPALCSRKNPPRTFAEIFGPQPMLATERRLRPDNVVQFPVRARIKGRFSA